MEERVGDSTGEVLKLVKPGGDPEAEAERYLEREWLERVGVNRRFRSMKIDPKLVPDECRQWVDRFEDGSSLILSGPVGSGKTVAAIYCLRLIYRHPARRAAEFAGCFCVKARGLYRAVFERDTDVLTRARNAAALVIDEWGGAYESEWPLAELDGLIDDRWEGQLATIVTTNTHPSEGAGCIKATMPRAYDRLCDEPGPGVVLLDRASMRGGSQ